MEAQIIGAKYRYKYISNDLGRTGGKLLVGLGRDAFYKLGDHASRPIQNWG